MPSMKVLHDTSSSCMTWKNLSAPSLIGQTRLNHDNLYPNVSFEPLIEDEESNWKVTPIFRLFISLFCDQKSVLCCFKQSNDLDISILESLTFILFSTSFRIQRVFESEIFFKELAF